MNWMTILSGALGAFFGGGLTVAIANHHFEQKNNAKKARAAFASSLLGYANRSVYKQEPSVSYSKLIRTDSIVTGFHAYEVAEWTYEGIARIESSGSVLGWDETDDTYEKLAARLAKYLGKWVMHPQLAFFLSFPKPFESEGVIGHEEWKHSGGAIR